MENETNLTAIFQIIVESGQMLYKDKVVSFSKESFESFAQSLPQEWWHAKDKIVYFTYYSDGTYFCEKERSYYDYALKTEATRVYQYDIMTAEDAKMLLSSFTVFFNERRMAELKSQQDYVRSEIEKNFNLFVVRYRNRRDQLLNLSDWVMLPDVISQKTEEEANLWRQYRQFLRDMPQSEPWTNNNYIDIVFPLSPDKFLQLYPGEEYLSSPKHFVNIATLAAKQSVLNLVKSLRLPSLDTNLDGLLDDLSNQNEMDEAITIINSKLALIDPNLRVELNVVSEDM